MFAQGLTAWFATYFLHSAVLLGAAWLVARFFIQRDASNARSTERLWRVALIGALLTSLVQTQLVPRIEWPAAVSETAFESSAVEPAPGLFGVLSVSGERAVQATQRIAEPVLDRSQWIIGAWALVAVTLFLRRSLQRRSFLRSLGRRRALSREERVLALSKLPPRVARGSGVRLTASEKLASPVVLSQREICLPERALREFPASALSSMLAHEYAHVARRDPQWLVIYQALEAALFFQPLVFVATRALRADAELASDCWAVQGGADALSLADSLATVAQWGAPPAGALGVLGERESSLMTRVKALLEFEGAARRPSRLATGVITGLVLGLACAGPAVEAPEVDSLDVSEPESVPLVAAPEEPVESDMLSVPKASKETGLSSTDEAGNEFGMAEVEPNSAELERQPVNVMHCEFTSDHELIADGTSYTLPGDWSRFTQELKRVASEDGAIQMPPAISDLQVTVRAREDVEFKNVLRLMGRCGSAQVWDIELLTESGRALPVPLPNDLDHDSLPIPEEEFDEESDEVREGPDPRLDHLEVRISESSTGALEFQLGPRKLGSVELLVSSLEAIHRSGPMKSLTLDVRGEANFADVCAAIDAILLAELDGVIVMFVGAFD
jgi:beta-lactamase regulating signal transducer with metallopeptidase domain